jgi:putative flippase GtrA
VLFIGIRKIDAVAWLPFGLGQLIARTVVGFALINAFTFSVDLAILVTLRDGLGWPIAASLTLAYSTAFALSYTLNRIFNFRSHAPIGKQMAIYVPTVITNFLIFILGVGDGLTLVGVDYRVARVIAGGGEAVFMYCAMRWLVFRDVGEWAQSGSHPRSTD